MNNSLTIVSMSRYALNSLRPYLSPGFRPCLKSEHVRVYVAAKRCLSRTPPNYASTDNQHVQKGKRLDHLKSVKPLDEYHPRLEYRPNVERLSPGEFVSKYDSIQDVQLDQVVVFGMSLSKYTFERV